MLAWNGKGSFGPASDSGEKIIVLQMHDEIDGAAPADCFGPIEEFVAGNRDDPLWGVPLGPIILVGNGGGLFEHRHEVDVSNQIGLFADVFEAGVQWGPPVRELSKNHPFYVNGWDGYGYWILGRRLTHFFILMTWLFSVSLSIKAAVS
jgi:hypothetical protein